MTGASTFALDDVDFSRLGGLVPVVAQDAATGAVLMVAYADREALARTLETGEMHYRSRTRGLWHKGATSGNVQRVVSLHLDCDRDTVLARVRPAGPACHTGAETCFGTATPGAATPGVATPGTATPGAAAPDPLSALDATIARRAADAPAPDAPPSYTRRLLGDRNLRLKKIGEEAAELVTACADGDPVRIREEAADLLYHALVALHAEGVTLGDVREVLAGRGAPSPDGA